MYVYSWNTRSFAGSFKSKMAVVPAVAEEAFLSDVHLYTPFLQTSKNNVGMYSRSGTKQSVFDR